MDIRKQSIGIDISKDTFTVCLGRLPEHGDIYLSTVEVFPNTKGGANRLLRWARPMVESKAPLVLMYSLYKNGTRYQPGYTNVAPTKVEATQDSTAYCGYFLEETKDRYFIRIKLVI